MGHKLLMGLVLMPVLGGVAGGGYLYHEGKLQTTRYLTAIIESGAITTTVNATGIVNAVTTVQVGSQVSGTIQKLFVDFNSPVKEGEVITQIHPAPLDEGRPGTRECGQCCCGGTGSAGDDSQRQGRSGNGASQRRERQGKYRQIQSRSRRCASYPHP